MIPVGRGQRELIIGDRQIGKTALAIDAIINQKNSGIKCVYVAIGQKQSTIANVVRKLEETARLANTIVVAASASESAALQFIAPYAGCTMGEYFRDRGEDALIVYDDLSKQAVAYRQISLLLRRPPGREAYPGDVFYLHSRLLSALPRFRRVREKFTNGAVTGKTGSFDRAADHRNPGWRRFRVRSDQRDLDHRRSDLPGIGHVQLGYPSGGQRRYLGIPWVVLHRPRSSRSCPAVSVPHWLSTANWRPFAQFASDPDEATRKQLEHGQRVTELMKQKQYAPMSIADMSVSLYAAERGFLVDIEVAKVGAFEQALIAYFNRDHAACWRRSTKG